jgi:hypothetical protein
VRIAYVLNERDLEVAVTILERALEAYPGRTSAPAEPGLSSRVG